MIKRAVMAAVSVAFVCSGAAQATVIGTETFAYPDGAIAGKTGGTGWQYEQFDEGATPEGPSDWDNALGAPNVVGGTLVTSDSSAYREYHGTVEGVGSPSNEREGAFRGERVAYYKFTFNTSSNNLTAGISLFDFDTEKMFFGQPSKLSQFGIGIAGGGNVMTGIGVTPGQTYTIVGEHNYDRDRATIWVNPGATDKTAPDARRSFTGTHWISKLRLASTNTTIWHDVVVATTFGEALGSNLVFAEDFDNPNGTVVKNTAPDVGNDWNQTVGGDLVMNNGVTSTSGGARELFGDFTRALGAGEELVLDFETSDVGNFHSDGYAGISLFVGGSEAIFIGDLNGASSTWGLAHSGTNGTSTAGGAAQDGLFTYDYNTGAYELSFSGITALSGTATTGLAIDRLRIANGNDGDIVVDSLEVGVIGPETVIPEPITILVVGLSIAGLGGYIRRRRPC